MNQQMKLVKPCKIYGGKHYLAKKFIPLMPPHTHFVEPYAGGLSVLLEKDPAGISEVVNDINKNLTIFWKVLQDNTLFEQFRRLVEATPFSQVEWQDTFEQEESVDPVVVAHRFFVRARQSRAGMNKSFATVVKSRTRRGMNDNVSAWLSSIDGLSAVHARLKRVLILNEDALKVIKSQDSQKTFQYLDPPYLHETRTATKVYEHEMTAEQHEDMLKTVFSCQSKFMISGYESQLYNDYLKSWNKRSFDIANHAAGGDNKRRMAETIWMNY
jgi:DNA adenine methylase